jgi:hypothetical protein
MPHNTLLSGDARITHGPSLKHALLFSAFVALGSGLTGYVRGNPDIQKRGKKFCTDFVERFTHSKEEPLTPCM